MHGQQNIKKIICPCSCTRIALLFGSWIVTLMSFISMSFR